ncbi:MAG: LPS export ABC transporter ATP-binding protein [Legionellales bacterium]|nr:LPS export ABC transporter ATP-binding protein [Legionellales bacterium]|tara:strand:+ start:1349 stop:2074 length:726 start_codon:yes stop_codon:yes gene_type:complete
MHHLSAQKLQKTYKGRTVVKDVCIEIASGEIVGLLGPNGAGKTTSFYMIAGLIWPDRGTVKLDGKDITGCPLHERALMGIGYLPQEASVFRRLSVADNVMAILETRPDLSLEERKNRLDELLEEFHISHLSEATAASLSGGERRRLEIARALAREPKFILLDEPFAGVDPLSVSDIKKQIQLLTKRGIGILITDHNVRETLDICGKAYIMNAGSVIASGTSEQVLQNQKVREVYLGEQFEL